MYIPPRCRNHHACLTCVNAGVELSGLSSVMVEYRIHFVDHAGTVFGTEHYRAEDDERAIAYARKAYRTAIGKGYEIWRGRHLVHAEMY